MPLPAPNLDDRRFQDLVDEAKRRIPRYCPEWTDHNVSDPGVTLIELFSWMTEQFLFRLNQVPERNFVTFLNLIGAELEPAQPARGDVTFTLTGAPSRERRVIIPAWTEVATERTETGEVVVFTTDREVEVLPPNLHWVLTTAGEEYQDQSAALQADNPFEIWSNPPQETDYLYFGFDADLSAHTLVLRVQCEKVGIGIDPLRPPWRWEVWRGNEFQWEQVPAVQDSSAGFNENGEIRFRLPYGCQPTRLQLREARTWLRCSPVEVLPPGESTYSRSPRVRRVDAYSIGITVPVTHARPVRDELLGISNGQPAQQFRLQRENILKPEGPEEVIEVETEEGGWEAWTMVPDFGDSAPDDTHYRLDPAAGIVEFGPAIRQRDGSEPQFGAIPPRGRAIRMRRYRVGGGVRGNVGAGLVRVLKSTLPYVSSVYNHYPITGGLDAEDIDHAKLRAPSMLRTRHRAVTAEDYEVLARDIPGVGRVRCLQPRPDDPRAPAPGTVMLLVIPSLPRPEGGELGRLIDLHERLPQEGQRQTVEEALRRQLTLPPATAARLREHLDSRRLLTTRLLVREPHYTWLAIEARVKAESKAEPERVRRAVKEALYRFLHPVYGGPGGEGWPFGLPLTIDKVYALIQQVAGVDYTTEVKLYPIDLTAAHGQRLGRSSQVIDIPPDGVLVSYYHNVYLTQ